MPLTSRESQSHQSHRLCVLVGGCLMGQTFSCFRHIWIYRRLAGSEPADEKAMNEIRKATEEEQRKLDAANESIDAYQREINALIATKSHTTPSQNDISNMSILLGKKRYALKQSERARDQVLWLLDCEKTIEESASLNASDQMFKKMTKRFSNLPGRPADQLKNAQTASHAMTKAKESNNMVAEEQAAILADAIHGDADDEKEENPNSLMSEARRMFEGGIVLGMPAVPTHAINSRKDGPPPDPSHANHVSHSKPASHAVQPDLVELSAGV